MKKPAPKYEEEIAIIPKLDGTFAAQAKWRDHIFIEPLPRGIQDWTLEEFQAHLRRYVVPKLRVQVLKAQRQALEEGTAQPEDVLVMGELSDNDKMKLQTAEAKRQRKALKLVN